ncbi:protein S100-A12-like [Hemicordylus capensis]|uniref:protein S100-A12-like n=1 Tax=Hemicordylus capensis TaxID=884348 RepID=UPI002303697A|nr:protein S100-A12-like [Hemicordylus capensis]
MSKTEMQLACDKIIDIYHQYSELSKDRETDTLDKEEFKKMIEEQFPNCVKNARDPKGTDKFFEELNNNQNENIGFEEYMLLLSKFLICTHEKFHLGEKEDRPTHTRRH